MPPTIAFNGHTLSSAFQPIYDVHESRLAGYEGLLRAVDGPGRSVRANDLLDGLDTAEIVSIDRTARTLHLRSFASVDPGNSTLFLNVHPAAAVADAEAAIAVRNRIGYFGLTPARVCYEILENTCEDEGLLVDAVAAYREMGLAIAMDDFGVARSNFDRVASLRPDYVKLDRTILARAVGDSKARRMLPSLIDMLHGMGARVVVEGIEDSAGALLAIEAGADMLQGYYFAAPSAHIGDDDALVGRLLDELVRMRGPAPKCLPRMAPPRRRTAPTADSVAAYREPPLETVE